MISKVRARDYDFTVTKLREFCKSQGFIETHTQNRLSILAACEDPTTIAKFGYAGQEWPLPQTGQMWLEHELLGDQKAPGFFCVSTSFRNEAEPIEGRHDLIFPMFEFEMPGNIDTLRKFEIKLLDHLGFRSHAPVFQMTHYKDEAEAFGVDQLKADHETMLQGKYGPVVFLQHFPISTSPFWNMKRNADTANKIDVLLYGMETIGSAERSIDPKEMREAFHTISDGRYVQTLYAQFGHERVDQELEEFLALPFFPRAGGGIGITRLIRALKLAGILEA